MAMITAQMIKDLRERTGIGMTKCKEALEEAGGDIEQAISILRKAGLASGVKKQGREAKEGAIFFKETPNHIAIVEVNAETDFVVKNERFQEFARNIVEEVAITLPKDLASFVQQSFSKDASITIDHYRSLIIQAIGENILISRICILEKKPDISWGIYSHLGGKIFCAVKLQGHGQEALAKDIAMHATALCPEYIKPEAVPQEIIEKEREIARAQVQGKPANVIDKIIEGKVNSFFDAVCLSRQKFVKDSSITIEELIKKQAQAVSQPLALLQFIRWMVGQ